MGVLNVTPDSFSDGGRFMDRDDACRQAEQMTADGAAIIDVGGESTRPGALPVSETEEIDRVVPVVEAVRRSCDLPISIDTSKPGVMRAACDAGASMINDVMALRADGALEVAAELDVAICLMHMQGTPRSMQHDPSYDDVVDDVAAFLAQQLARCVGAGIAVERIVLDPGFGFGKTHAHNVELLANLRQLQKLGQPLLVGLSRKSTLGAILGQDTGQNADTRMAASLAAAVLAVAQGAAIVRAHDVRETADAIAIASAVTTAM